MRLKINEGLVHIEGELKDGTLIDGSYDITTYHRDTAQEEIARQLGVNAEDVGSFTIQDFPQILQDLISFPRYYPGLEKELGIVPGETTVEEVDLSDRVNYRVPEGKTLVFVSAGKTPLYYVKGNNNDSFGRKGYYDYDDRGHKVFYPYNKLGVKALSKLFDKAYLIG